MSLSIHYIKKIMKYSTCTRSAAGAFLVGRMRTDICRVGKEGVTVKISLPPVNSIVSI